MNEQPQPAQTPPGCPQSNGCHQSDAALGGATGANVQSRVSSTSASISRRAALGLTLAPLLAPLASCATTTRPNAARAAGRWRQDPAVRPPTTPREFRGVWVATVANIDWPTAGTTNPADLREQMTRIIRKCKETNLNAILLQVRPSCDAIYRSRLEPWSEFLTGRSGQPPTPEFDPLIDWITHTHNAGLELHAWFNPFRARHHEAKHPDAPSHVTTTRPGLIRFYSNLKWLDPGEPESQNHSLSVVADVARRYDIDGIHFDDYFYPYPVSGRAFPDESSYARYGSGLSRADWRRANIDSFVQRVGREIKSIKPDLPFGISPFGIWRPGHPIGVEGLDAYEALAADARKWLREGWIDYASPQLYWKITAPKQPFGHLLDWWHAQNPARRHVWPGLYTSKVADAADPWPTSELINQINLIRAARGQTPGIVHFSATPIVSDTAGIATALRTGPFADPALPPRMSWLPAPRTPQAPIVTMQDGGALTWFTWRAWENEAEIRSWTVWTRNAAGQWRLRIHGANERVLEVSSTGPQAIDAVAIAAVTKGSTEGTPWVMRRIE